MRKVKLTFLLFILSLNLMAPVPSHSNVYIAETEKCYKISLYEQLALAVAKVETGLNSCLINEKEQAYGAFQIRQCKLDDYNQQVGTQHKLEDCFDYNLSRQIFLYFAEGKTLEQAAKDWNGSGPMTIRYWENVKKLL